MSGVDVIPGEVLVLTWDGPEPDGAEVLNALGVSGDPAKVDIFEAERVAPVGLDVFLAEGHGVEAGALAEWRERLAALEGIVVVLPARALEGGRGRVEIGPPAVLVARLNEAAAEIASPLPIETASARGNLGGRPGKSEARVGGMVAMVVLLFLAAFVVFFVLMAG